MGVNLCCFRIKLAAVLELEQDVAGVRLFPSLLAYITLLMIVDGEGASEGLPVDAVEAFEVLALAGCKSVTTAKGSVMQLPAVSFNCSGILSVLSIQS
jgi:hypothetical protein